MKRLLATGVILSGLIAAGCGPKSKDMPVYDVGLKGLDDATRAQLAPDVTVLRVEERKTAVQANGMRPLQKITRVTYQTPDGEIHMVDLPKN